MSVAIQEKVAWLIPSIRTTQIEISKYKTQLLEVEEELRNSPTYKLVNELKWIISDLEKNENDMREQAKNMMIENNLHDFTTLDWQTVQLNKTPWALVIDDWAVIDEKYYRIKKEIDKAQIKKDFNAWLITDPNIYIQSDYKLIIKA